MKDNNILQQKSYAFAIRVVRAYQYLANEKKNMCFQSNF